MRISVFYMLAVLFLMPLIGYGQEDDIDAEKGPSFFSVDERKIVETKWRYTYAMHLESSTIIHQADEGYEFFLYFKYDYTYQQFLNGEFDKGIWSINDDELFYKFKHINKFVIADIDSDKLILEFKQPNSSGTYQYHFISVTSDEAPFIKPANELPDINVDAVNPKLNKKRWWASKRKKRIKSRKKDEVADTYINIELIGGGYYGGIDPVIRDYIHIKSDGRLIKEFKSLSNGLQVTKKNISRDELEDFAEYIIKQKFFDFDRIYDCDTSTCQKRKAHSPTPIPLRLAIAYGNRKKVVTIAVWGDDGKRVQYVDYPPALDNIIDAIQRMAHRIDDAYGSR